ncbi:hypothetical protein [uncultured Williamsia sp.]|uniref:hypothetical protein n=1 Tax=uncultured Williamsia sp. TaxID=259311 RepID=UPI00262D2A64|nr:hypothetical protein [uncultured Williamsia sp.]
MRYRPLSPDGLVEACVDAVDELPGRRVVAVDGPDAADPVALAETIALRLRVGGRAADVVDLHHWLRPASTRMEWGRTDAESYRTVWFDLAAIGREVIDGLRSTGEWLPRLWDPQRDRSFRDVPSPAGPDQVVLLAGPMLVGSALDIDLTVALRMTAGALRRRTPEDGHWTIAPLLAHEDETGPADIEVRWDHPDRPAVRVA